MKCNIFNIKRFYKIVFLLKIKSFSFWEYQSQLLPFGKINRLSCYFVKMSLEEKMMTKTCKPIHQKVVQLKSILFLCYILCIIISIQFIILLHKAQECWQYYEVLDTENADGLHQQDYWAKASPVADWELVWPRVCKDCLTVQIRWNPAVKKNKNLSSWTAPETD